MEYALAGLVLFAITVYLAYAIIGIVGVRGKVRWLDPSRIEEAPIDSVYEEVPALRDGVARLAPLGFIPVKGARVSQPPTNPRFIVLRHPFELAMASVMAFGQGNRHVVVSEFVQRDAHGRAIAVNNASVVRVEPPLACSRAYRFPGASATELWHAFKSIRATGTLGGAWQGWADRSEIEIVREASRRQVSELHAHGYLETDGTAGPPRLTLRGAVVFTLKLMWPWKYAVGRAQVEEARRAAGLR